jgi:hypothetical protein
MKNVILSVVLIISVCPLVFSQKNQKQEKHFTVERAYPDGKQTSFAGTIGDIWSNQNGIRSEKHLFPKSYDEVWEAAKQAAQKFSRIGKRPLKIDEEMRRISNSNIERARNEKDTLIQTSWIDEITTEVTYIDQAQTKVIVSRKVLEIQTDRYGKKAWGNVASNGKIERWILTQIEDEINNGSRGTERQSEDSEVNTLRKIIKRETPKTWKVDSNFFTFDLQRCRLSGTTVICEFIITNNDRDRKLQIRAGDSSKIYDENNNEASGNKAEIANSGKLWEPGAFLINGISTKARIYYENVSSNARTIARMDIRLCPEGSECFYLQFRNIPLRD